MVTKDYYFQYHQNGQNEPNVNFLAYEFLLCHDAYIPILLTYRC